ncbi:hypothetical protein SCHPADRAFT_435137 [Schizopora paradoxa]|uniref:Uncharacterized protein n=1 Tax=Schizopora paradoxa TaxID=27342 RepID=A0A0H2RJY4_9AGAM|nr:hypothetical protein SCHPADRAFT_435137 [Schizopora paradoxa]
MASSLSIINSAQPIPRITLPRNGPVASSSAQAGPSSQYQTVGHPSSASHSVMHAYPHAPPYTHAPNPHAPHQLLNATSSHSPYSVPAAAPPPYHSGHPAGPYPAFSYGHGVGTGTYSYYSSYGQPYLYHQQGPAQAYGHVSAPVPATQVQPYGYGPQGYPVLTVPLRPLQPIPVSGTVVVGERRRTPVGTNAHGNGNGNQKARFATFHVSDPASLAARYGHNRPDTSGTSSKDRSQSSKPEIAQPITTPTSGVPQVNTSMSNSRPAVQQSQPISTMTTPITPINVTPFSEIPSNLIAERSFQTAPQPTSTPTLSEFHAAAKQLEVLGADAGTNALDPARLEAVLENRPELREAAKMLLTYGQAQTETQDK